MNVNPILPVLCAKQSKHGMVYLLYSNVGDAYVQDLVCLFE